MSNYEHKKPLIQSALVLVTFLCFFLFVQSAHPEGFFGGIAAVVIGTFKTILFFLGLSLGLIVTIATLMAIFFIAIALYSPDLAGELYVSLRKRLAVLTTEVQGAFACECSSEKNLELITSSDEYKKLEQLLQQANSSKASLSSQLEGVNIKLNESQQLSNSLKQDLDDGKTAILELQEQLETSSESLTTLESDLKTRNEEYTELQKANKEISAELEELKKQVAELESEADKAPEAGIFSYIEDDSDKDLFAQKVDEALEQEMTYAQIDAYLTEELDEELDAIIKAHPSLTKNFIRNKRR